MSDHIPIRFSDPTQQSDAVQKVARDVTKILTPNEELLYVAVQNQMALTVAPDCVAATNNRIILYNSRIFGRAHFADFLWQDVANTKIEIGMLSAEFFVDAVDGRKGSLGELDKEQAKRLYGICQQLEQEWREKRRVRQMEEERARSGGIYMSSAPAGEPSSASSGEDPVQKLAKAKAMLDQGLISETEYDTLKAKILSNL
jgi:hypothetical protein